MKPVSKTKNVLANQNAVPFLIYLYKNGASKASYLQEIIKSYNSIKNIAASLEEAELISVTEIKEKNIHIVYDLTDLGREVAKKLVEAENMMYGLLEEDDYIKDHKESIQDSLEESHEK